VDIGGTARAVDTEVSYDTYTGSLGAYGTTTRDATFWDDGAIGLFSSGDHAYLLVNCGIVSLLATKANGGLTVRVTGATITDWAEFELFGSDDWPSAFDGGWIQIVVDIDELLANPTNTNGTPPTVGNIQRFGVTFITATVMPRMADNTWVGGFYILPSATPAIIVEGRSGGTADWTLELIRSVAAVQLSAVLKPGPAGSFVCRGPIQIGINDTSTHAFTETNKLLLFDYQQVMLDGFYKVSALGNVGGTTNVKFGVKTGTGAAATGAQGGAIQAASAGARFDLDFDDPNVDLVGLYGLSLQHLGDAQFDDAAVDTVGSLLIDSTTATLTGSNFLKNKVITPNTAANEAAVTVVTLDDIDKAEFVSGGNGHAVQLGNIAADTPMTWDCTESGYVAGTAGASVDDKTPTGDETIDCDVDSTFTLTINVADGASTPSVANAGLGDVDVIVGQTNFKFTLNPSITGYEWRLYEASGVPGDGTIGTVELDGEESAIADNQTYTYTHSVDQDIAVQILANGYEEFLHYDTLTNSDKDLTFNLVPETNT
jgi:hypothetical protein